MSSATRRLLRHGHSFKRVRASDRIQSWLRITLGPRAKRVGSIARVLTMIAVVSSAACSDDSESTNPQSGADASSNARSDANEDLDAGSPEDARSDAADSEDAAASARATWAPVAASQSYLGRSLSDWVLEWARWHLGQNDCEQNAYFDLDGSMCGTQQSAASPVFFLEGGEYPTDRSQCKVPADKALLVPLTYFVSDGRDAWMGAPSEDELREQAQRTLFSMRDLEVSIDGVRIDSLDEGRAGPVQLDVEFPPEPNYYTCRFYPGIEGLKTGIFLVGVFVLFPPPQSAGEHVLEYGGTLSYDGWDQVTRVAAVLTFE